ncbi:MAG: septal ring lytic transglycosylase RlpA family lipoprotein [Flavobacteriaceae bacterium]|nr:MAG: septal ring lytic transglycosylase RlpA family lipoprotein [Flavobacteriaceae bacterium]
MIRLFKNGLSAVLFGLSTMAFAPNQDLSTTNSIEGKVSYYGTGFHGKPMANGQKFDKNGKTCAVPIVNGKKTHPFGTKLEVTNKSNNKKVIVTVTDTGGFAKTGRVLDLSQGSFEAISSIDKGIISVSYVVVK